jgi:hypothetical protein
MQELRDSTKKPILRILGIDKQEEVQGKGICNVLNKIIREHFPNFKVVLPIQVQQASRILNRLDQNRTTPWYITIKSTSTENREKILKAVREKKLMPYKCKPIKITATLKYQQKP